MLLQRGEEGGGSCLCFKQEHTLSLVSQLEEIDALVRGQREENTKLDLSSQPNKGNAIKCVFKVLV